MGSMALSAALLLVATSAMSAPRAQPWAHWEPHDERSTRTIDHGPWTGFLECYVVVGDDGIHRVAYGSVTAEDRRRLDTYLRSLQQTPIGRFRRAEQLAFWINLYNALTVRVILDHRPVESIRDISISPGLLSQGPWGRKLLEVDREPVSLDDIEHRILRPIWGDPRIHYAVNCASIGCPNLATQAFTASNTERLLEEAAVAYVNHPRGAAVRDGDLHASSIYDWFEADFGGESGVLEHLRRYARPELASELAGVNEIQAYEYDWSLNETLVGP
jgi:hypothetical protein